MTITKCPRCGACPAETRCECAPMPSDAEQLARLQRMIARTHPSEWTREAFPGDIAAIRWAVQRIGQLEGDLKPDNLASRLHQAWGKYQTLFGVPPHGTIEQIRAMLEFGVASAALSPAPAKEGEKT